MCKAFSLVIQKVDFGFRSKWLLSYIPSHNCWYAILVWVYKFVLPPAMIKVVQFVLHAPWSRLYKFVLPPWSRLYKFLHLGWVKNCTFLAGREVYKYVHPMSPIHASSQSDNHEIMTTYVWYFSNVKYNCTKFQHDFGEGLQAPIIIKGIFSDHNMLRLGSISSWFILMNKAR